MPTSSTRASGSISAGERLTDTTHRGIKAAGSMRLLSLQNDILPRSIGVNAQPTFLLDDRGNVHPQVRFSTRDLNDPAEDALTAVKERGYVEWGVRHGHVSVRLRPSLVSASACAKLLSWLQGHLPLRVLLSSFVEGDWQYEFLRAAEAARRVPWLIERYGGGGSCNVRRRRTSIASIRNPPGWMRAVEFWRRHRESDPRSAAPWFDAFFDGRWIMYTRGSDHALAVRAFGASHSAHVGRWLENRRGMRIAEPADRFFAQNCEPVYRSVAEGREPRSDESDVISHWAGSGRRRSQFRRLVLPFASAGQTWLLSGIQVDPTINLLE
jgi:hypothetical protein